ncbi:MAG: phasin family protein [Oxalobacteraceae bacterium]|nr:phasin family protein [Oxalobacteraceae bacterium]
MFLNTDQYVSASKALVESQFAAVNALTDIAVQGTEKVVILFMAIGKASAKDTMAAANNLLAEKHPQAFVSLATACAKPNTE